MISSTSWEIIVAEYRQCKAVAEALGKRGCDLFVPLEEKLTIIHGRHMREMYPLLGDYIPISITSAWRSLCATRGVSGFLLNDLGFPAQVLPHEMERLRSMCDGNIYRQNVSSETGFSYGQKVSPTSGPFAYHVGRYDKKMKRGDAALFVLFGREQRIVFKAGELIAA